MTKASKAMRLFLFNASVLMLVGLWLTGFDQVHWFAYLAPGFFLVAAASGICPGLMMTQRVLGKD